MSPTVDCGNQLPTFRLNAWNARAIDAPTTREYSGNGGTPCGSLLSGFRICRPLLQFLRREMLRFSQLVGVAPQPLPPGDMARPPDYAWVSLDYPTYAGDR